MEETAEFLNQIEKKYEKSVAYQPRASPKWVTKPFKERNAFERFCTLDLGSEKVYAIKPKNPNPPPEHNIWLERLWLSYTIPPALIIQALWYHFVPETSYFHTWHPIFALVFYIAAFVIFTAHGLRHTQYYMEYYGTFDEDKRPRDYIPDKLMSRMALNSLVHSIGTTSVGLIIGGYDRYSPPSLGHTISWFFIVKIGLWLIVLDFFFYSYHRTVHTVPFLWKFHSLHHSTKHPTAIQTVLGSCFQDNMEFILIPLASSLVVPLTSYEFWIAQCILIYIEGGGHSGIRAYWPHVILYEVLKPFGMEICIEDHDLHHRYGKSGKNYGKQTRIFDRMFGTLNERVECIQK